MERYEAKGLNIGWRIEQEEGKKIRSRERVLAAKYLLHGFDEIWLYV